MIQTVLNICLWMLLGSLPIVIYRIIKGPSVMDRLLCLDTTGVIFIGILVLLSIQWKTNAYLDIILVFSTFGFLSTVSFSYYLHKTYKVHHKTEDQ